MPKIETFETETLKFDFVGDWIRTNKRAYEGSYSFGSKSISSNQQSTTSINLKTDYVEFFWYVSSENNYDWFEFYIDGNREIRQSGSKGWNKFSKELSNEQHEFIWKYTKDRSSSSGDDKAYIDNLILSRSITKYLFEDDGVLKTWSTTNQAYETINLTSVDLTEEVFVSHGMDNVEVSRNGLVDERPKIYLWTNEEDVVINRNNYCLELTEIVTSKPQIVSQKSGVTLKQSISSIEIEDKVEQSGDIQYAFSKDGVEWYVFNKDNNQWQIINIQDDSDFESKGMRKSDLHGISTENYQLLYSIDDKFYLAIRFNKPELIDVCKFISVIISYVNPIEEVI